MGLGAESISERPVRELPGETVLMLRVWSRQARIMRWVHVTLVVVAVTCSLLGTTEFHGSGWWAFDQKVVSFIAALAIALLSAFELGVKANGFRAAWRTLTAASWRYRYCPEFTIEQLTEAYEAGEREIGDLKASPTPH